MKMATLDSHEPIFDKPKKQTLKDWAWDNYEPYLKNNTCGATILSLISEYLENN